MNGWPIRAAKRAARAPRLGRWLRRVAHRGRQSCDDFGETDVGIGGHLPGEGDQGGEVEAAEGGHRVRLLVGVGNGGVKQFGGGDGQADDGVVGAFEPAAGPEGGHGAPGGQPVGVMHALQVDIASHVVSNADTAPVPVITGRDVRRYVPVIAQILGVVAMAVGFGLVAVWAGLVTGGLGLLAAGTVAEVNQKVKESERRWDSDRS